MTYAITTWVTYEKRTETHRGETVQVFGVAIDHAACDWNGQRVEVSARKGGALGPLARRLHAFEAPDGPWMTIDALDGKPCLEGKSLHRLSQLTVKEDDRGGPRFVRWEADPRFAAESLD